MSDTSGTDPEMIGSPDNEAAVITDGLLTPKGLYSTAQGRAAHPGDGAGPACAAHPGDGAGPACAALPGDGAAIDWSAARAAMMLDPGVANLNTGSFGPLPRSVFDRVTVLRRRLAEAPMAFLLREAPPLLWQARERLACFIGTDAHRLIFMA